MRDVDSVEFPRVVGQVGKGQGVRYVAEVDGDHIVVVNPDGWTSGWMFERARWMRLNADHLVPVVNGESARAALAAADLSEHRVRSGWLGWSGADFDDDMDWFGRWEDGWDDLKVAALAPGLGVVERARDFVHRHRLPPPRVRWVSMHGEVGLVWEDPEGEQWQISFGRDGSVVVEADLLVGPSSGELPVERELAAAVALIGRWYGIESDGPVPGIDTPLVIVSIDTGWMVESYLFDVANRTVECTAGPGEEDLSAQLRSLMEAGTTADDREGGPAASSWNGSPETLAGDVAAAGFLVDSWHVWGGPPRAAPTVGDVATADTFDALVAEVAELEAADPSSEPGTGPLSEATVFPSANELRSPDAVRRRGTGVDLEWGCGEGVVTVRFRSGAAPDATLATIWGVDSETHRSSDPLVVSITRALLQRFREARAP